MNGEPRRALRRDAVRNREKVLDAALTAFRDIGPDASLEQIAHLAGVSPATLYRRFASKDAIVAGLVEAFYDKLTALAAEAQQLPPAEGLAHFLHTVGWHLATSRTFLPRAWGELATPEQVRHLRATTGDLLAAAQAAGEVNAHITVGDIAMIVWALRGVIETTGNAAGDTPDGAAAGDDPSDSAAGHAWQRHLALVLAGLRADTLSLPQPSLDAEQIDRLTGGNART